jgi:hypothetical protein
VKNRGQKKRAENVDGLGPKDIKRLVTAIRKVWGWNYARRLCLERAISPDGFPVCEKCHKKVPKVWPDHIEPIGTFHLKEYIARMFVSSKRLQALCKNCHRLKTNKEAAARRRKDIDLGF